MSARNGPFCCRFMITGMDAPRCETCNRPMSYNEAEAWRGVKASWQCETVARPVRAVSSQRGKAKRAAAGFAAPAIRKTAPVMRAGNATISRDCATVRLASVLRLSFETREALIYWARRNSLFLPNVQHGGQGEKITIKQEGRELFSRDADLFFLSPRTQVRSPNEFGVLYLLRRDIDQCMGIDPDTGQCSGHTAHGPAQWRYWLVLICWPSFLRGTISRAKSVSASVAFWNLSLE